METFRKTVAVFLAILFIGTTALTLALYNVERSAFDTQLYIQAMDEENIYQRLPELTAQSLAVAAQRAGNNSLLSIFQNLSEDDWRRFVSGLIPPEVLRTLADGYRAAGIWARYPQRERSYPFPFANTF